MASLREVKDRIASVRSTLKITSAMKLVASSKLRRAQRAIEALRPYEETLSAILAAAGDCTSRELSPKDFALSREASAGTEGPATSVLAVSAAGSGLRPSNAGPSSPSPAKSLEAASFTDAADSVILSERSESKNLLLAFSSNSSMCGAFNANVIKKTLELAREYEAAGSAVDVWAFGRKMVDALRKAGRPAARDLTGLVAHPSFDQVSEIAAEIRERYNSGEISGVILVYNHFVSMGKQQVLVEDYGVRRMEVGDNQEDNEYCQGQMCQTVSDNLLKDSDLGSTPDYIIEPSRTELLESLIPQVLDLKLYAALLDSAAAEHAARMIAMQTATDNAEELLGELTLEYNKGRQQKITAEILDLVGAEA